VIEFREHLSEFEVSLDKILKTNVSGWSGYSPQSWVISKS